MLRAFKVMSLLFSIMLVFGDQAHAFNMVQDAENRAGGWNKPKPSAESRAGGSNKPKPSKDVEFASAAKRKGATHALIGVQCMGSNCQPLEINSRGSICRIDAFATKSNSCQRIRNRFILLGIPEQEHRVYLGEYLFVKILGFEDVAGPGGVVYRTEKYKIIREAGKYYKSGTNGPEEITSP